MSHINEIKIPVSLRGLYTILTKGNKFVTGINYFCLLRAVNCGKENLCSQLMKVKTYFNKLCYVDSSQCHLYARSLEWSFILLFLVQERGGMSPLQGKLYALVLGK